LVFQVLLVHHSLARDHTVAFLSARGQRTSKHLSHHVKVQVTCTRLGSDRATSHVSMIVFAISLSGDFLVVSLIELNLLRPKQDASAILWDPHVVQFLTHCITLYTECSLHSSDSGRPPSRKLIIAKFNTPALDSAGIGRILRECQPHIPVHYRETAVEPLLVFEYDRPIGRQWINTKKYADLSKEAMTIMCQTDCNCYLIPERFKKDGHLLTTSPELLPSLRIQKLASMGSEYRPSSYPGEFNSTTKQEVLSVLRDPILAYADSVERRVGMTGIMNARACSVLAALETQLDTIRHGTPLRPAGGIPYTSHDRRVMHRFLEGFVGHGCLQYYGQGQ